jgi:hypothetical protein
MQNDMQYFVPGTIEHATEIRCNKLYIYLINYNLRNRIRANEFRKQQFRYL